MDNRFDYKPKIKINKLPENPDEKPLSDHLERGRFPKWLHRKMPSGKELASTNAILKNHGLNTVCEEAKCPNRLECYSKKTATFLVLGKECTRACGFCDIDFNKTPSRPDPLEPKQVASSVKALGLKHVVITMVARDDLPDGGAAHLIKIIEEIKIQSPLCTIEILTSDFLENYEAIDHVLKAKPEIFNYNIETVKRLTPRVRHTATYERTLRILTYAKKNSASLVKSGIMVGLGETMDEVKQTMKDLSEAGCDIVTIGQYLQASQKKLRVQSFITPDEFEALKAFGISIGLKYVYAGPFVRSSYNAKEVFSHVQGKQYA